MSEDMITMSDFLLRKFRTGTSRISRHRSSTSDIPSTRPMLTRTQSTTRCACGRAASQTNNSPRAPRPAPMCSPTWAPRRRSAPRAGRARLTTTRRMPQTGRHQLSVNGKFADIERGDLLALAERFAIGTAESVLDEVGKVAMHH